MLNFDDDSEEDSLNGQLTTHEEIQTAHEEIQNSAL
jgi:hypothetical protein